MTDTHTVARPTTDGTRIVVRPTTDTPSAVQPTTGTRTGIEPGAARPAPSLRWDLDVLRVLAILGVVAIHIFGLILARQDLRGTATWHFGVIPTRRPSPRPCCTSWCSGLPSESRSWPAACRSCAGSSELGSVDDCTRNVRWVT